jgi:hypothetical protein
MKNGQMLARYLVWYIDVLSLNNFKFDEYVNRIYPINIEIEDITDKKLGMLHTLTYK